MEKCKKKNLKICVWAFLLFGITFLLLNCISAVEQPSPQFSKIFFNPFYIGSSVKNVDIPFTLYVYPVDKIKNVTSAVINFDVWMNPSVNFTLLVNGQSCNNPFYYISNHYASAGKTTINFDCGNVIKSAGTYSVILKSNEDIGALVGWLDLNYINNPKGTMAISGTEYSPDDPATIFLQLKDAEGLPVTNGVCYVDMWYPLSINGTHPYTLIDAPMMKAEGDDGLYYYDFIAPSTLGVYMLSSKCVYALDSGFCYSMDGYETDRPNRTAVQGTFAGDTIFLNDFEDWIYTSCASTGGGTKSCEAYYDFNLSANWDNLTNFSYMNLYYMGEASAKINISFYFWNWTSSSWVLLPNSLIFAGLSSVPLGIGDFVSNSLPSSPIRDIRNSATGVIRIRTLASFGSNFNVYSNWLNIQLLSAEGLLQDLKGSGEVHITNIPQATANLIQNMTLNVNASLISNYVWNATQRNLTYTPDLTNYYLIQTLVWNATDRNLTYERDMTNYSLISNYVWNATEKNLTYYQINNITASDIWNFVSRNLTYNPDMTNYSEITKNVWSYENRNLTFYETSNLTASEIWNYATRGLTQNISAEVWAYSNKTLTYYPTNNLTADDIWNYVNRSLTQDIPFEIWTYSERNLTENISYNVWNYNNRTLTFYPEVDLSQVPASVWNYSIRNLTFYEDTTNYSNVAWNVWNWVGSVSSSLLGTISNAVWTNGIRNLTFYEDTTNYSKVAEYVWMFQDRNLTFYQVNNLSPEDVWNYVNRNLTFYEDTTNYSQVAEFVWFYVDRNLTTYQINNISASEIWTYYNRSLTEDIPLQIWSYANRNLTTDIPMEVWNYFNRTLTYYTLNLTELIDMINEYNFTDTIILLPDTTNGEEYVSNTLNVTLIVPS